MSDTVSAHSAPKTAAEYKAAIEDLLGEMQRLNEQMQSDQAVIERLKADSARIKAETRALLAAMSSAA
jgi:methyl-accepting chemotaxis protein